MNLIDELRARQGQKTQDEFSLELDIDQSSLSRIYAGKRKIGLGVARKICRRYPELAADIVLFFV